MLERMDDFFTARVDGYDEHMRQYVEEDSKFYADTDDQEAYFRRELLRLRKEQNLPNDVFYHYDTPMTAEHEKRILLSAGFSKVEELGSWDTTHTLRAEK